MLWFDFFTWMLSEPWTYIAVQSSQKFLFQFDGTYQSINKKINVYNVLRVYLFILLSLSVFSHTPSCAHFALFHILLSGSVWETIPISEVNIDEDVSVIASKLMRPGSLSLLLQVKKCQFCHERILAFSQQWNIFEGGEKLPQTSLRSLWEFS